MSEGILVGRLIESNARLFRFSCTPTTILLPQLGDMVCADTAPNSQTYGIIGGINFTSDDLTTRLAQGEVEKAVLVDNQYQRFAGGQWVDVAMVGYRTNGAIIPALPPRPPLNLEKIKLCTQQDLFEFTRGSLAYFRLLLELENEIPLADVLSSHLKAAHFCHSAQGNPEWIKKAVDRLLDLLNDFETLLGVMTAVSSRLPDQIFE
jgi:hypothetical protein